MKLIITKDHEEMSQKAAEIFSNQIKSNPKSILGLATGGTPERMYELLVNLNKSGINDWSGITTFNLDEYIGIEADHSVSYRTYMNENLFSKININLANTHVPKGTGDIELNCKKYDEAILAKGGIDLQVLGIGENAHIAFNEPGSPENGGTSIVNLTESTIQANSRYFKSINDVPKTAITMGIGSILKARKIILLASGVKKAQAIKDMIEGPMTDKVPASFLQKHNDLTIIVDQAAASLLKRT